MTELQSGLGKQSGADPVSLYATSDVQVVQQGSPLRIVVENRVGKPDDVTFYESAHGELIHARGCEATGPNSLSFRQNVAIEIRVEVRASVVVSPALSVQGSNGIGIMLGCLSVLHRQSGSSWPPEMDDMTTSSSVLALAPCRSRLPDRRRARSLRSLVMNSHKATLDRRTIAEEGTRALSDS